MAAFGVIEPVYLTADPKPAPVNLAVHTKVALLNFTADPVPHPSCFVVPQPLGWGDGTWGEGIWGGGFALEP